MSLLEHRDRILKNIFKPAFKTSGFSVSGTTFKKQENGFIKIFNIQSSGFNVEDHVSFYLNIGLLFPIGFEIKNEQHPKNPKGYDCQFNIRSDSLTGRNQTYELTSKTNIQELENLLLSDIQKEILPFYERYSTIEDCIMLNNEFPNSWTDCRPFIGLTMIKNGNIERGDQILNEFLPTTSEDWKQEIIEFRKTLN